MKTEGFRVSAPMALALVLSLSALPAPAAEAPSALESPKTVLTENRDFDRSTLMTSGYGTSEYGGRPTGSGVAFLNPNRFSMRQSYSMSFSSSSYGALSSGLYLNTLSYKLAEPLTLTADVGFHMPLYAGAGRLSSRNLQDPSQGSSVIFPSVGLEYKPSKHTSFSLNFFNGEDAMKAYGAGLSPFHHPWVR
jgi:hypothetical protein